MREEIEELKQSSARDGNNHRKVCEVLQSLDERMTEIERVLWSGESEEEKQE